ncbi:MAG TPA: hypothetical protein VFH47_00890 [Candidatus Thermoplasmatota archaeon]|nr:hypothetical protein [Candidatus Thermoplasmatota archaeon]
MSERALAAMSYVPMPGLAFLLPFAAPASRLVRHHAWQGGALTAGVLVLLMVAGFAVRAGGGAAAAARPVAGVLLLAYLAALGWGVAQAACGRYGRVRGAWDVVASLRRLQETAPARRRA